MRSHRSNRAPSYQSATAEPQPTPQNGAGDSESATPVYRPVTLPPHPYVDIDDLDEDDDDDEDDLYDGYSDYTDFNYESEFSDFDFDMLSFSGASSGSTHQPSVSSGWPSLAATTAATFGEAHPRRFRCYACGALGHKANECRLGRRGGLAAALRAQQTSFGDPCRYCGRHNHTSDKCFRRPLRSIPRNSNDNSGDNSSAGADAQSTQRPRCRSPPPPLPPYSGSRLTARQAARLAARTGTMERAADHPAGELITRVGTLRPDSSHPRLRSPPPQRLVTPPPPQSPFASLNLGRSMARAAAGPGAAGSSRPTSSTFGRPATHVRRDPICYRCKLPGHISRDCVNETDRRECWACGRTGHLSRDCPLEM